MASDDEFPADAGRLLGVADAKAEYEAVRVGLSQQGRRAVHGLGDLAQMLAIPYRTPSAP